jgi:hypothetical protein
VPGVPLLALGVVAPVADVPEGLPGVAPGAGVAVPVPFGFAVVVPGVALGLFGEVAVPFWPGVALAVPGVVAGLLGAVLDCGVVVCGAVAEGAVALPVVPLWPVPDGVAVPAWANAIPALTSRAAGISNKRIN